MAQRTLYNPHISTLKTFGVIYNPLHVVVTDGDGSISRFIVQKEEGLS